MTVKIADLKKQRATVYEAYNALAQKATLTEDERKDHDAKEKEIVALDDQIARVEKAQKAAAATAQPVAGQERVAATPEKDPYLSDEVAKRLGLGTARSLVIGGMVKMIGKGGGMLRLAREEAAELYGAEHPVTKALVTSVGASGGFIVPPDYMNEIIELLRPETVVRSSNPRVIPMPRGTMTLPNQKTPATASYGAEGAKIASSQQTVGQIVASFKKLTALVPVSNDMMRYADPAVDAFVRDDLVDVLALREDLAFMLGDGTQNTPRGFLSFANGWVLQNSGTAGNFSSTANSTAAVDGAPGDPLQGLNGGNFATSTQAFTLATVAAELGAMVNYLDTANVKAKNRVWFMNPRSYNYLYNVQNSLGVYVYRDELNKGTLLGYPVKKSTQIPTNIWNTDGSHKDCSFIFLVEMPQAMILDSMTLELAVSREGTYVDAGGNTVSAFQYDQTLIRAIAEHDFQMRHDSAIAVDQLVRWAPAGS